MHTMEYNSALKGNQILIHDTMWMSLQDILLSEMIDAKVQILYDSISMQYLIVKCIEKERIMAVKDWERGLEERGLKNYSWMGTKFHFGMMEKFWR